MPLSPTQRILHEIEVFPREAWAHFNEQLEALPGEWRIVTLDAHREYMQGWGTDPVYVITAVVEQA